MTEYHQYPYEDEIDLRDLILKVWRGRWVIIGAVAIAVVVAFIYATFIREPAYEARVSILPNAYRLADGRALSSADYLPIFHKESILEKIVTEYMPDEPDVQKAIDKMINIIEVDVEVDPEQEVTPSALVVSMRHKDRATAMEMTREYIRLVQSEIASLASQLNDEHLGLLERSLEIRTDEFQKALDDQQAFRKTHDIETLRSRLANRRSRLISAEVRIEDLQSSIKVLTVSLEHAQAQLAETDPLLVTKDVLDETSVKLFRQIAGDGDTSSIPYIEREHINPVYTQLLETVLTTQRQLESRKIELENAMNEASALREEIEALLDEIADAERKDLELDIAVSHARSAYESAYSQYNNAINAIRNESYTLTIISGPWASTRPVGTSRLMMMALAAVLAGFISVSGLLFAEYMRTGERQTAQPPTRAVAQ
ncbi:MAG TPA: Wzz/FepE/Etk N-terminal domain-containing protein [Bacillota bacterium]|nr:Wzz/FepE/Etk N-terminal domain-containing protein [Bacillota bacterium]